jgi:mannose/fructose/N-acetylgalactosamine-specific phosphotransferase system component IIB
MGSTQKTVNVSNMVHKESHKQQTENRSMLVKVIESLKWLARQGLAIRGHDDNSGNFLQLLKLRGTDCCALQEWLTRKTDWLSHDI